LESGKPVNKQNKIAFGIVTLTVLLIAAATLIYLISGLEQTNSLKLPGGNPPIVELKLTGDITPEKTLTIDDLTQIPLTNVTVTNKEETANYLGVSLLTMLNKTSPSWYTGNLNVKGTDTQCTLNTYQALNSTYYSGKEYILAFAKNGQWLTTQTGGPLQLVTPETGYNVKSITEISFEPWAVTVNGKVAHNLTLTGKDLSSYEIKTVQAGFAPGGEPQRVSNWTGITLPSILDAAGVNAGASKVTVTAVDGYSKQFTLTQVQSSGILLGFQENGVYLSLDGGLPFRLMIPTEEFKWGQYWVRWVTEITVT
jgi:DMSO/TMAO reductase YedYZ molybdopterin-dependent catalytic subunit